MKKEEEEEEEVAEDNQKIHQNDGSNEWREQKQAQFYDMHSD